MSTEPSLFGVCERSRFTNSPLANGLSKLGSQSDNCLWLLTLGGGAHTNSRFGLTGGSSGERDLLSSLGVEGPSTLSDGDLLGSSTPRTGSTGLASLGDLERSLTTDCKRTVDSRAADCARLQGVSASSLSVTNGEAGLPTKLAGLR